MVDSVYLVQPNNETDQINTSHQPVPLARIIHEHFCCNRRSAATTSLRSAESPFWTLNVLHEYASGPQGSARRSRDTAQRFRDELS